MASRFASVSKEKTLKINKNPFKHKENQKKIGVSLFDRVSKFLFFVILYSFLIFFMASLVLAHEIDCRWLVVKLVFVHIS